MGGITLRWCAAQDASQGGREGEQKAGWGERKRTHHRNASLGVPGRKRDHGAQQDDKKGGGVEILEKKGGGCSTGGRGFKGKKVAFVLEVVNKGGRRQKEGVLLSAFQNGAKG